mgnify:CR=1 FL=1
MKSAAAGEIVTRRRALALIEKYDTRTTATTNAAPRRIAQSSQSQPAATDDRPSSQSVSPASASPPTAIDVVEQWRSAVEALRQLCEQPLSMSRVDIDVLADQLLELALHLRTASRNAPPLESNGTARKSVTSNGRGKRRSPARKGEMAVA